MVKSESLYIFVPTDVRATSIQDELTKSCRRYEVTAFGRAKDFYKQLKIDQPTAILALGPIIERQPTFTTILQGYRSGSPTEKYYLLALDQPIDLNSVSDKKIGAIDILGRSAMKTFINQTVQNKVKIKRVTKQEDLLHLLSFGFVDVLLTSDNTYQNIKEKSNLNLIATDIGINLGLPGVAIEKSNINLKNELIECIKSSNKELNIKLGVEEWKTL